MGDLVADALVQRLQAWGIDRVFGFAGDGIDPLLAALSRADGPEYVGARHEEGAALMAVGHAKFTGSIGCCVATHGPGAIHLVNGLYDAKLDSRPVVALVGQQHRSALGTTYQQEIDTASLLKDVCSAYTATVTVPEQLLVVVDRAIRTALARRAPTAVILPHDVQQLEMPEVRPHRHAVVASSVGFTPPHVVPRDEVLRQAADLLDAGERVALLVGQGAAAGADQVREVARRLGAGIATSLLGKPVIDELTPGLCGCIGHLGSTAAQRLMEECDTLLMIGTNDPWTEYLPVPGQARAVQIDIDGSRVGLRYPTEVNLVGDTAETLDRLLPLLAAREPTSWRNRVDAWIADWRGELDRRAHLRMDGGANPQRFLHELSPLLPDDAMVALDVGSVTYWYSRHLNLRGTVQAHLSSTLASMGSALPYALAAKLAHPDRLVVALLGDGAMLMNGINELVTVAQRWRDWPDPRLPVLVLRNDDLNEVTWEQREMEGDARFAPSQDVPPFDYAGYGRLLGLAAIRVERDGEVAPAWHLALEADRPMIIEAVVDPATPLLPPTLGDEQLRHLRDALEAERSQTAERARSSFEAEHGHLGQTEP